jgi:hypothetical protein
MVTTTAAVTTTMQIVEYHVKYNTTTIQTPLKQTTVVVGVMVNLDHGHNRHLVFVTKDKPMLCPYSNRLVSQS